MEGVHILVPQLLDLIVPVVMVLIMVAVAEAEVVVTKFRPRLIHKNHYHHHHQKLTCRGLAKLLLQISQAKFFLFSWLLIMWNWRFCLSMNLLSQGWQYQGFME